MNNRNAKEVPVIRLGGLLLFPMCAERERLIYMSTGAKITAQKNASELAQWFNQNFKLSQIGCLLFIFTHTLEECRRLIVTPEQFLNSSKDFMGLVCPDAQDSKLAEELIGKIGELVEAWRFSESLRSQNIPEN